MAELKINSIFFISMVYILFNFSNSIQMTKESQKEIDQKLVEMYQYYENIINKKNKTTDKIISSDPNKKNKTETTNNNEESNHLFQSSFLQSEMEETKLKNDVNFSYQPFVWTEFTTRNTPPSARRGHSSLIADTYMIVFGGCYMESKCYNDVHFLDLSAQSWIEVKTKGKIPSGRQGHSSVLHGTTMWVYGGSNNEGYLNDLYSFNLETVF